jgi:hypothetical protein
MVQAMILEQAHGYGSFVEQREPKLKLGGLTRAAEAEPFQTA